MKTFPVNLTAGLLLAGVMAVILGSGYARAKTDEDTAAINQILDRLEQAYPARDAQTLADCAHEGFVAVLKPAQRDGDATVLTKKALQEKVADAFARNAMPKTHRFAERRIFVRPMGPVSQAFVLSVVKDQWPDGREQESKELRVFLKEGGAWRVLLAMPIFFEGKALVTQIKPGSQAGELGLRAGDTVAYYAGEKIEDAGQLVQAVQEHSSDAPGAAISLIVIRGTESLPLKARPGELGCMRETRVLPAPGAEMIDVQTPHPVKETVARLDDAWRQISAAQMLPEFFPGGAISYDITTNGLVFADPASPRAGLEKVINLLAGKCDLKTLQCDQVRAIVQGPIVLVTCRCRVARAAGGEMIKFVAASLYARKGGRWYWVAPLTEGVDIGLNLAAGTSGTPANSPPPLKYGLFIHFGITTFAAVPEANNLIETVPPDRYAPTRLDVRQWARTAKDAGMSFAVLSAKHQSGFCLWDSQDYNYDVGGSPVKTDVVKEFVAACQAEGVAPGVYYSLPDTYNEGELRRSGPIGASYFKLIRQHITELHTKYPGIRLQLFEAAARFSPEQFQELCRTIKRLNPQCIILVFSPGVGARLDPKNEFNKVYVGCDTVNNGNRWFWSSNATLNPPSALYAKYNEAAVQGHAFLLNVGPDRTGCIPDDQVRVLMDVKKLMAAGPAKSAPPAGTKSKPAAQERLQQLKELYNQGLIPKAEYDRKVKEILDSM